jgi:hypothetical protein
MSRENPPTSLEQFSSSLSLAIKTLLWTTLALKRHNTENLKQIFPEKELLGLSSNFHIHVAACELLIY